MPRATRWCRTSCSISRASPRRRRTRPTASSARSNTAACRSTRTSSSSRPRSRFLGLLVELGALLHELHRFLLHALLDVVAHVLRDLHGAEVRAAHRAEVRHLGAILRQRLVVEFLGGVGIETEVELVGPAKLEARLR